MIKIEKLTANKISLVQQLAREIWDEHYIKILSQEQIDYMLDLFYSEKQIQSELNQGVEWFVLYSNNKPVGYLSCKLETEKLYISKIYLKTETRGKGFGKLMIEKANELANQHKLSTIYLNVNKYNKDSILFYQNMGFEIFDEGVFEIGNGYIMDDFLMEKKI